MRYLISGLLILAAAAAFVTVASPGHDAESKTGTVPRSARRAVQSPFSLSDSAVMSRRGTSSTLPGDVDEVVVTAERPARLMPEVVVSANLMPEVVVRASWTPAALAAASPQASFVN